MAGRNRPSFLKNQKEQQRRARATRKREERLARKQASKPSEDMSPELGGGSDLPSDGDPQGEAGR